MRLAHLFSILAITVVVAACATNIKTRQALDAMSVGKLQFGDIEATSSLDSVTPESITRLKMSVAERLGKLPQGALPVKLDLVVTEFDIQNSALRLVAGRLAGSNKMTVSVRIVDGMGMTVADFDVQRVTDPGRFGGLYSQANATVDAVADGIADVLNGKKGVERHP
jgi:hypothetical protein